MINFEHIQVAYGEFTALPDFDLEINEGEFFTFLGPSGCGKSTVLRTLAGFNSPKSGKVYVNGHDVTFAHSSKRGIGMVFQNYALFPSMNVQENIEFGLKTAKFPATERERRVSEIAKTVDLAEEQMKKQVSELSGGQQQRVAIARALVMKPSILLLDEPLSNLDARLRKQLRGELRHLQGSVGFTTVYVTHDQEEALSLSDRIAVLNEGKIEQVGSPRELYEDSDTEFVCTFLGEVNRISKSQVSELNRQGAGLEENATHYIRLEKLKFSNKKPDTSENPMLKAKVKTCYYFGDHEIYELDCLGSDLKIIKTGSEEPVDEGTQVYLTADPRWIRSYDENGKRIHLF
jgi:ABC-type spermidine/putrescine transport system, ATPase component